MAISRRRFLGGMAAGAATFTFVPGSVLGLNGRTPANERLNIAAVGIGGMGKSNIKAVSSENIVALCDVDDAYAGPVYNEYPNAKRFRDYRKMLDQMDRQIDAVIIATPDHTHAVIALECMKRGKHVYVQKPLTRTVYEARILTEAARKYKVVTQMGNQGASSEEVRLVCEWIWDGAIGQVREVHAWTNRPVWPQGIDRPGDTPDVPQTLDWDLWLGPAPKRPYHPAYHPFNWRAWQDFGTGALGDMACHVLDPVFRALKLRYPTSVEACVATQYKQMWKPWQNNETYPISSIVRYQFPARDGMPAVRLFWYDGGMMPPRPDELEEGRRLGDSDGGVLFVGDKGKLVTGCYSRGPQLIPYSRMKEYKRPEKTLPRISTSHEMHWVQCCKEGKVDGPSSHFEYAGPFTESVVMGNLAIRFPNQLLLWDGQAMKVTNNEQANAFVNPPYREGWSLQL